MASGDPPRPTGAGDVVPYHARGDELTRRLGAARRAYDLARARVPEAPGRWSEMLARVGAELGDDTSARATIRARYAPSPGGRRTIRIIVGVARPQGAAEARIEAIEAALVGLFDELDRLPPRSP